MQAQPETESPRRAGIATLLRGDLEAISRWSAVWQLRRAALHVSVIIIGAGSYGAAMGWWRHPRQALFTAIKLPLIILLTTGGNALLNAMLALLFGLNITLRQSLAAVLMSFTVAAAILGAFSPLLAFLVWNAPAMASGAAATDAYNFILLVQVAVIALAGATGNARLFQLLRRWGGSGDIATRIFLAWLGGNLLLGSQLAWVLRPFVGAPSLPVEFFRAAAFRGNFFEAVGHSFLQLFATN